MPRVVSRQDHRGHIEFKGDFVKAFRVHRYADCAGSSTVETDVPTIRPDEVLIRVKAAAVNPMDWKIQAGFLKDFLPHRLPLTLGWDVAGLVEQVGDGVSGIAIGDAVFAMADITRDGTFAEYAAVRGAFVARKPSSMSYVEAACVPLAGMTAWTALFDGAGLQSGQSVLIQGGAGGVGSFAIQLARNAGARVTATCSSGSVDLVKSLGADVVVDYTREDVSRHQGFDAVIDTVGGDVRTSSFGALKPGGILVTLVPPFDPAAVPRSEVRAVMVGVTPSAARLAQLATLIDAGKLRAVVAGTFDLSETGRALAAVRDGHVHGKLVVTVG